MTTVRTPFLVVLWSFALAIPLSVSAKDAATEKDFIDMNLEELLNVEVSVASKKPESLTEAPGIVSVVPREEFVTYGDRDLLQLLQRQPGVYTRGSYLYPHNLASFRGDLSTHLDLHTLVLFNGRPIRGSSYGGINFPTYMTFPLASLGGVELVRGPGSVLYGTNAFTGVVNLKSRPVPDQSKVSVSGMTGSHGYYDSAVSLGGRSGALGYVADVQTAGQQGYDYRMTDDVGVYDSHGDRNQSLSGATHLEYGGLTFDGFASNLETFYLGVLPRWSASNHDYRANTVFGNLGYRLPLHDRVNLEFNLTYNLQRTDFTRFGRGDVDLDSQDYLGEVTLLANPTDRLNIIVGYLQEYQQKLNGGKSDPIVDPPYTFQPQSAYAQGDYRICESLKAIAGAQWNESGYDKSGLLSRYGAVYTPFKKGGLKLLRGEAFRAPFALETGLNDPPVLVGNEDLDPERIVTHDAQVFYNGEKTYAAITYFHSEIRDLIIRDVSVVPASFKNGGSQDFEGIELEAKQYLTPHWQAIGSFTYQQSDQTADIRPSTVPPTMVKAGTAYTWDWGSAGVFCSYFSKPPRLATEVVRNPEPDAIRLLSLHVRIDPSRWLGTPKGRLFLILRGENLLNEEIYVPEFQRAGNPNSLPESRGATFYTGLTYTF
jgi:outer membrane receptor protein involved in Fe transport